MPDSAGSAIPNADSPVKNGKGSSSQGNSPKTGSYLPDIHRSLPHSTDAEKGVLCSFLISEQAANEWIDKIKAEYFHIPAHATIFELLVEFWNARKPVDFITISQALQDRSKLDEVGGAAFVSELFNFIPTAANAEYYTEILKEKRTLREIIKVCTECAGRAYDEQDEVNGMLDEVEQKIFKITESRVNTAMPEMKTLVIDALKNIEKLYDRKGVSSGLSTGYSDFDSMTDGLHEAEMIVIAARPSMGKTALAMNIAENVAVNQGKGVAVFSLEMSSSQLVQRLVCSRARVSLKKTKDGFLSSQDFPKIRDAASAFASCPMFIDDTSGLSVLELRAKARRLKARHDIQLIVIDYLQLLRSTSKRAQDNRQLEIAEISSGIKAIAKELKIPIIVLAQLNRKPEDRGGGRPRLSDLRESGSIEQDADVVGLLVRSEYYAENEEDKDSAEGEAELIIAKQRNGPIGDIPLTFLKEFTRFENRVRSEHAP